MGLLRSGENLYRWLFLPIVHLLLLFYSSIRVGLLRSGENLIGILMRVYCARRVREFRGIF